jgi:thioredoxin-dependent peroxiredoxin
LRGDPTTTATGRSGQRQEKPMTVALEPGQIAPNFTLPRDGGGTISLADHAGKPIVLYFYPADDTPSCTKEAQSFSDLIADFTAAGAVVLGVSPDPVRKHDKFRDKYGLKVVLLADDGNQVIESYGLWIEKSMYGKTYMGVERATFLIGADGRIVQIWHNVRVKDHAEQVLAAVRAL